MSGFFCISILFVLHGNVAEAVDAVAAGEGVAPWSLRQRGASRHIRRALSKLFIPPVTQVRRLSNWPLGIIHQTRAAHRKHSLHEEIAA